MQPSGRLWPNEELRAGDADRRAVVVELQRHFVDGRLTSTELDERISRALAARTFGELAVPLSDLPVLTSESTALQSADVDPSAEAPHSLFAPVFGTLLVAIGLMALVWMLVLPT